MCFIILNFIETVKILVYIHRDMIQETYTRRHDTQAYIDMTYLYKLRNKLHMYLYKEMIQSHLRKEI